ncbi:MAG: hypothetical protein ABIB71_08715 [Candidatus Woesearchaeota archaeon]
MRGAILLIIIALLSLQLCMAADIGVSPAQISVMDVMRGGYAEMPLYVSSSSQEGGFVNATIEGEISKWISFEPTTPLYVNKDAPARYLIKVQPPEDIPNGVYNGKIKIMVSPNITENKESQMLSRVKVAVNVVVGIGITDIESFKCKVRGFSVGSVEKGEPLKFKANIRNEGNVRVIPKIDIEIWDVEQRSIVKFVKFEEGMILPTLTQEVEVEVPTDDLNYGQYWAVVAEEDCLAADTLTFDILEPGALREDGTLEKIVNKVWSYTGDNIQLDAIFLNTGQKKTIGQFRGRIAKGDVIYKELESDEQVVEAGESINFTFFFTPKESGRYVASGRVFYGQKRTYEASSIINVKPGGKKLPLGSIVFYAVVLAVFFLAFKIRKERKKGLADKKRQ